MCICTSYMYICTYRDVRQLQEWPMLIMSISHATYILSTINHVDIIDINIIYSPLLTARVISDTSRVKGQPIAALLTSLKRDVLW